MGKHSSWRIAFIRGVAALLVMVTVLGGRSMGSPSDVFSSPAPVVGSDPPKAAELRTGDASVSTQTGQLSYAYPIQVPPGRGGMVPHIALNYSSQAPIYGTIASGWSLSLPAILEDSSQGRLRTRSPEVETQQGVATAPDDDRFISTMAGGRPLIKVTEPSSAGVGWTYRAQNDSSYTRYEKMNPVSTPPAAGQFQWRAYTTAGVVMKFGETDHMGGCPYLGPGYAPLTSEIDPFGNLVIYDYGWAVSGDIGDCAIKQITWGMNAPAGIPLPLAKVAFGWTIPNINTGFAVGGSRDYRTGKKVISGASRLSTITVTAFAQGAESSPDHTRLISLGYDSASEAAGSTIQHAPLRMLTSIQESAWFGRNGYRVDLPAVTFGYAPQGVVLGSPTVPTVPPWTTGSHPTPHRYNLGWGYRRNDGRWATVEELMVDLDGDGLLDRLTNTSGNGSFTNCTASWQRNLGPNAASPPQVVFSGVYPIALPRLKWGSGTVGVAGTSAQAGEGCSLNAQITTYQNSQASPPGYCHDSLPCQSSIDPEKPGQTYCNPGGTICPPDLASPGTGPYSTYLAYRWLDADGDGITDLVAAVHGNIDRYDIGRGNWPGLPAGGVEPFPFGTGTWPACPGAGQVQQCRDLGGQLTDARTCSEGVCTYNWGLVNSVLASSAAVGCFKITARVPPGGGGSPTASQAPYTRCEGLYPWFIFRNSGNGTFPATPVVKYQPIPLESDQGDSALSGPSLASQHHGVFDVDGDGVLDGVAQGKELGAGNPDGWYAWLGDGTGGIGPKRYFLPTRPTGGSTNDGNNRVSASVGPVGAALTATMGTTDLNGDGLPDHWLVGTSPITTTNIAMNDGTTFELMAPGATGEIEIPSFVRPTSETTTSGVVTQSGNVLSGRSEASNRLIDVDNDGRLDIVSWSANPAPVYYNLGGQFLVSGATFPGDAAPAKRQINASSGIADGSETLLWELNTDLIDLDGDGISEGVSLTSSPAAYSRSLPSAQPPRLMTSVDNGRGLHSYITYASMHEQSATSTPTVQQNPALQWWDLRPKATPREQWVVKSIRVEDDFDTFAAGTGTTTTYQYTNPRHGPDDAGSSGFRGFETVTTTGQSGAKTIQTYGYDIDWSGRLVKTVVSSAESPTNAVSVDKVIYQPFSLFPQFTGVLKTFHAVESLHFTCQDNQTELACAPADNSGTAAAAYTRTLTTITAKASDTAPDVPLMYVESAVRSQHAFASANGDRASTRTFWLAANGSMYLLRSLNVTKQSQVLGAMVTYGQSASTWDASAPAYARKLTDEVWVDNVNANRSVTQYVYEPLTGNLASVTTPRGYTTNYEYDGRKLFVAAENNPVYFHNLEFDHEYGTGTTTETRGPNVAICYQAVPATCTQGMMIRDANRVVIDALGRTLERWESVIVDPVAGNFALVKAEIASYVDTPVGTTTPTSVTHQAVNETGGAVLFTKDKTDLDGHGRPTQKTAYAQGAAVANHVTTYRYRLDGTLQDVSVPHPTANDATTVLYTYTFDSLGRPLTLRRPDSGATGVNITYSGLTKTAREWLGGSPGTAKDATTRTTVDADGRPTKIEEATAAFATPAYVTTTYAYAPDDSVIKITDPEGKITDITNDFAGHRLTVARATGTRVWRYAYDLDGNLSSEITPCTPDPACRGAYTTTFIYDPLDRAYNKYLAPRALSTADLDLFGSSQESIVWDSGSNARGKPSQWLTYGFSGNHPQNQALNFDPQGRVTQDWQAFNAAGFSQIRAIAHDFYLGGRPKNALYYDSASNGTNYTQSKIEYDARGLPLKISISPDRGISWQPSIIETRNVAGLVTKRRVDYPATPTPPMPYAESVWTYDLLGRVTDQKVNKGPGTVQVARQALVYFVNDDPTSLTTYFGTTAKQQTFTYDNRHQLKTVVSSPSTYFGATYVYGLAGRFTQASETQSISPLPSGTEVKVRNVNYNYAGPDPEQVTSLTNVSGGATLESYTYDLSGNQLMRTEPATNLSWTYLYDGKDQLRRATKKLNGATVGSEEYWYDANAQRTQLVKRDAANVVTELVWFSGETEAHYNLAGTVLHAYANISLGTTVARTDRTNDTTLTTEYQFHGLASSTLAAVSSTGTINASFNYAPFGEVIESTNAGGTGDGTAVHKRRFNDKQQDDISGLTYYGARYYDKLLMNWTQADPLYVRIPDLAKQSTPRRSNVAAFSLNNPVRYVDPDGLDSMATPSSGDASNVCSQDASGRCTVEGDGAAAYDGEKGWLASNTAVDKSKRGAERGAARAAEFNATQAARPRTTSLSWKIEGDAAGAQQVRALLKYDPDAGTKALIIAAVGALVVVGGLAVGVELLGAELGASAAAELGATAGVSVPAVNYLASNLGQGKLSQILTSIQQGYAAALPRNQWEALTVVKDAAVQAGLHWGYATYQAGGAILLENKQGVFTTIGADGSIVVQRGAELLLHLAQ